MKEILIIGSGDYGNFVNKALQEEFQTTMIDGLEVDVESIRESMVYVATPHFTHYDLTLKLLGTGKDVLCEKPLALSLENVKDIYKTADRVGRYLGTGLILQNHPFYSHLKKLQDKLGPIKSMKVSNCATESRIESDWYWSREKSGGWFVVSEIHWYHLFVWLTEAQDADVVEARETKEGERTVCTESIIKSDLAQTLTLYHKLDSRDEEIRCSVEIQFEGLEVKIDGWIPSDISMSDPKYLPDTSVANQNKDEVYHKIILSNVTNMRDGIKYDREAVILAHKLAFEAQEKAGV